MTKKKRKHRRDHGRLVQSKGRTDRRAMKNARKWVPLRWRGAERG